MCEGLIFVVLCITANSLPRGVLPCGYTTTHVLILSSMATGPLPGFDVSLKLLRTSLSMLIAAGKGTAVPSSSCVLSFRRITAKRFPRVAVPVHTLASDGWELSSSARWCTHARARSCTRGVVRPFPVASLGGV